ncbi:MAG: hypothetical protein Q9180_000826 [Flavoplaca navasiana]
MKRKACDLLHEQDIHYRNEVQPTPVDLCRKDSPALRDCLQRHKGSANASKPDNQAALVATLEGVVLSMNTSAAKAGLRGRICHALSCTREPILYFAARAWGDVEKEDWIQFTPKLRVSMSELIVGWHWREAHTSILPLRLLVAHGPRMMLCIASLNLYEARATNGAVVIWAFENQKLYVLTWVDLLDPHMRYTYRRRGDDVLEIDWDTSNLVYMDGRVLRGHKLEIELHRRLQQLHMEDDLVSPSGFLYDELLRGNPAPNPTVQHDLPQVESLQRFASPAQHQATSPETHSRIRSEEWFDRAALENAFITTWNNGADEELQRYILSNYTEGSASSKFTLESVQDIVIDILRRVDSLPGVRDTIFSLLQADMNATSVIQSYTRNYRPQLLPRPQLLSLGETVRQLQSVEPQTKSKRVNRKDFSKENKSSICDKSSPNPSEVEAHNLAHPQKKKLHPCPASDCSRNFNKKSNLKRHIKTVHPRLKPYLCQENEENKSSICDKSSPTPSEVETHNLAHPQKKKLHPSIHMPGERVSFQIYYETGPPTAYRYRSSSFKAIQMPREWVF